MTLRNWPEASETQSTTAGSASADGVPRPRWCRAGTRSAVVRRCSQLLDQLGDRIVAARGFFGADAFADVRELVECRSVKQVVATAASPLGPANA